MWLTSCSYRFDSVGDAWAVPELGSTSSCDALGDALVIGGRISSVFSWRQGRRQGTPTASLNRTSGTSGCPSWLTPISA